MPVFKLTNATLQTQVAGGGSPLVLLHGFPLDHSMWRGQIEFFARSHQVIAPDLRGFGQSSGTSSVTMEAMADDVAELLNAMGVEEPVALCGLSMGGYIAFAFEQRHRERLRALILCDTRAAVDSPEVRVQRHLTADRVLREGTGFLAEGMIDRLVGAATRTAQPALPKALQRVIREAPPGGVAAASRAMAARADARDHLALIDCPSLVIVGEQDVITPPEEMVEFARKIPDAHFVRIPEAGHLAPLEQSEAFNRALDRFLQRVSP